MSPLSHMLFSTRVRYATMYKIMQPVLWLTLLNNIHHVEATVAVPPGFEELAQGQLILVNVILNGESLGLYQANIDLEKVDFIEPNKLINIVANRYKDSVAVKDMLTTRFARSLPRNSDKLCKANTDNSECGHIIAKDLEIIYDEENTSVELFISGNYIKKVNEESLYFTQTPETQNSFIHQQNINFATNKDYQSASIQGNGTIGVMEYGYANVNWSYLGQRYQSDTYNQFDINNAYLRQDIEKNKYVQGGVLDAADIYTDAGGNISLSQLPIMKMAGVRVGTTTAWINKSKISNGTPITVFLSRGSRIEAYRGQVLIQTFYLKAGAQRLNTSSFPDGSYNVTLKIFENNQLVRTQNELYTSINGMQANSFQWFIQAGKTIDKKSSDTNAIVGGVSIPLSENLTFTTGSTLLDGAKYWEGSVDWSHYFNGRFIDGAMTSRFSYFRGDESSSGNIQQVTYNDGFSLSFYRSVMSSTDCRLQSEFGYAYNGCYKNSSVTLSLPINGWGLSLGYSKNKNNNQFVYRGELPSNTPEYNAGAPWEQIFTASSSSQTWQTGLNKGFTFSGVNINTSLNAFVNKSEPSQIDDKGIYMTLSFSRSSQAQNSYLSTTLRNNSELSYSGGYSEFIGNTSEGNEIGVSFDGVNTDNYNVGVYRRTASKYGQSMLAVSDSWNKHNNKHSLSSSGNYNSSLIISKSGLTLGEWGGGGASSAVLVHTENEELYGASSVNISLDNGKHIDTSGRTNSILVMPGYSASTLSTSESFDSANGTRSQIYKGAGNKPLFMSPGKLYKHDISVGSRYTWLGKMMDSNNLPLDRAIPLNVASWDSIGGGEFLFETTKELKVLYIKQNNKYYRCPINPIQVKDVIRFIGDVRCKDSPIANKGIDKP